MKKQSKSKQHCNGLIPFQSTVGLHRVMFPLYNEDIDNSVMRNNFLNPLLIIIELNHVFLHYML